ncbi:hypothetical protein Cadr_000013231 [Camelus dromedarius]|uniref:Uncharacterized protein n=1 Tax=Camelus dromedarius TaxID=9838 RepID=A0A5N4DCC6_CAMDR|nr:hypothetical protein Cadr_000013231 [Camelus dromedarius]
MSGARGKATPSASSQAGGGSCVYTSGTGEAYISGLLDEAGSSGRQRWGPWGPRENEEGPWNLTAPWFQRLMRVSDGRTRGQTLFNSPLHRPHPAQAQACGAWVTRPRPLTCHTDVKVVTKLASDVLHQVCGIVEASFLLFPLVTYGVCRVEVTVLGLTQSPGRLSVPSPYPTPRTMSSSEAEPLSKQWEGRQQPARQTLTEYHLGGHCAGSGGQGTVLSIQPGALESPSLLKPRCVQAPSPKPTARSPTPWEPLPPGRIFYSSENHGFPHSRIQLPTLVWPNDSRCQRHNLLFSVLGLMAEPSSLTGSKAGCSQWSIKLGTVRPEGYQALAVVRPELLLRGQEVKRWLHLRVALGTPDPRCLLMLLAGVGPSVLIKDHSRDRRSLWEGKTPESRCQDVFQAQLLGLVQMARDLLPALMAAGHVQDGLQATVIHSGAGDHHGGGHIYEEGPTCPHPVKPAGNFFLKRGSWGRTTICHLLMGSGSQRSITKWQAGPDSRDREGQETQVSFMLPPSPDAAAGSPAEQGRTSRTRIESHASHLFLLPPPPTVRGGKNSRENHLSPDSILRFIFSLTPGWNTSNSPWSSRCHCCCPPSGGWGHHSLWVHSPWPSSCCTGRQAAKSPARQGQVRDDAFPGRKKTGGGNGDDAPAPWLCTPQLPPSALPRSKLCPPQPPPSTETCSFSPGSLRDCYLMQGGTENLALPASEARIPREGQQGPTAGTLGFGRSISASLDSDPRPLGKKRVKSPELELGPEAQGGGGKASRQEGGLRLYWTPQGLGGDEANRCSGSLDHSLKKEQLGLALPGREFMSSSEQGLSGLCLPSGLHGNHRQARRGTMPLGSLLAETRARYSAYGTPVPGTHKVRVCTCVRPDAVRAGIAVLAAQGSSPGARREGRFKGLEPKRRLWPRWLVGRKSSHQVTGAQARSRGTRSPPLSRTGSPKRVFASGLGVAGVGVTIGPRRSRARREVGPASTAPRSQARGPGGWSSTPRSLFPATPCLAITHLRVADDSESAQVAEGRRGQRADTTLAGAWKPRLQHGRAQKSRWKPCLHRHVTRVLAPPVCSHSQSPSPSSRGPRDTAGASHVRRGSWLGGVKEEDGGVQGVPVLLLQRETRTPEELVRSGRSRAEEGAVAKGRREARACGGSGWGPGTAA